MIIKYSVGDLPNLNFRYLVQIENHEHYKNDNIFDPDNGTNAGFWIEKRLKFLVANYEGWTLSGAYYGHSSYESPEELVEHLNGSDTRYYRALSKQEVMCLTNILNKEG